MPNRIVGMNITSADRNDLQIKKNRKGIAETVQQPDKDQRQSLEQRDRRQRRQADP